MSDILLLLIGFWLAFISYDLGKINDTIKNKKIICEVTK